ncbi:hypothetical protein WA026_023593 [Henosepilachna vigintioctopunctata]|uniref:Uncharacterized protein n=1 Tax=Henosepilachna vigintioctopunctata TaxID=420089 RepID=A0AAW1UXR9_9CUCU
MKESKTRKSKSRLDVIAGLHDVDQTDGPKLGACDVATVPADGRNLRTQGGRRGSSPRSALVVGSSDRAGVGYPVVVCLTETWLSGEEAECFHVCGYVVANYSSRVGRVGGGKAILVRSDIVFDKLHLGNGVHMGDSLEVTSVRVLNRDEFVNLVCIYRAPSSNCELFFVSLE